MDTSNPLRSVTPTVDADVLLVLARTAAPLTGARVAVLAERSYGQVRAVLHRLVEHGLVDVQSHGNAYSYTLNRAHVAAAAVERLSGAAEEVERRIEARVAGWNPSPCAVVLFGSFARREGDVGSDLDLLLVRPSAIDEDEPRWRSARYELVRDAEAWSGNRVQIIELSEDEVVEAARAGEPLIAAVHDEGVVLFGRPLRELLREAAGDR